MQAGFTEQESEVIGVFVGDHHPQTAVLGQHADAGFDPAAAPG